MQDKLFILPSRQAAAVKQVATSNLPGQLTTLIGREQETAAACALLRRPDVRLLTFTGAGGVGKTRLGLQVATDLFNDFSDGACFVSLAPISDPNLVPDAIAQALDLKQVGEQPPLVLLKAFLREQQLLLLLDNFEQVVTAAPALADLLAACPGLKALVTSRTVLRMSGEYEFPVPPLGLPDLKQLPEGASLAEYAAVALFLQRAQAIKPDFQITPSNARAIAEICVRLDGLPLAIELAAARIKLLPPQALLARLSQRLAILTSGAKDAPVRQQTLRNTLAWSYDLLDAAEQRLFWRLSVFVGGCSLEAIEAVSTVLDGSDVVRQMLDRVASLIDKSLLQQANQEGKEVRLMMLETIREYALERLTANEEMETTRQAHALYYLRLAEQAEPELRGLQQAVGLERLEQEHDNLRAAMQWTLERGEAGHSMEIALRLGGTLALLRLWLVRGYLSEGRSFLERALARSEGAAVSIRAKALEAAANLASLQDDTDQAEALFEGSLTLYRELGDRRGMAASLFWLGGIASRRNDLARAHLLIGEALTLQREVGDKEGTAWSLFGSAALASIQGEYTNARALYEEGLSMHRQLGNKHGIAWSLFRLAEVLFVSQGDPAKVHALLEEGQAFFRELDDKDGFASSFLLRGRLALSQDDAAAARSLLEESARIYKELGHQQNTAESLSLLARVEARLGAHARAHTLSEESVMLAREVGDSSTIAFTMEGLAGVVLAQGYPRWAARLLSAAESLRVASGTPIPPVERADYERLVATARTQLGKATFAAAWAEGRTMPLEQALAVPEPVSVPEELASAAQSTSAKTLPTYPAGLTAREVEVLHLVAQGLTDAQVAEQLIISPRTVNWHLTSIYSKIGVSSRSAATRYAIEQKLL